MKNVVIVQGAKVHFPHQTMPNPTPHTWNSTPPHHPNKEGKELGSCLKIT